MLTLFFFANPVIAFAIRIGKSISIFPVGWYYG